MTDTIQQFDQSINLSQALLWQYNEAARLQSLLLQKQVWYEENQAQFWDDWFRDVFDLRTANLFGLSVWAIILGQPIVFNNVGNPAQIPWGFNSHVFHTNFNRGNFTSTSGYTLVLNAEDARVILQLRYFQLTSSGTVPETNRMLKYVFGNQGLAYLKDLGNMTQEYIFNFALTSDLEFLFNHYDILPRPSGVQSSFSVMI